MTDRLGVENTYKSKYNLCKLLFSFHVDFYFIFHFPCAFAYLKYLEQYIGTFSEFSLEMFTNSKSCLLCVIPKIFYIGISLNRLLQCAFFKHCTSPLVKPRIQFKFDSRLSFKICIYSNREWQKK